jgi:hypothetical protein
MKKEKSLQKLSLNELKVESFITSLENVNSHTLKGGASTAPCVSAVAAVASAVVSATRLAVDMTYLGKVCAVAIDSVAKAACVAGDTGSVSTDTGETYNDDCVLIGSGFDCSGEVNGVPQC